MWWINSSTPPDLVAENNFIHCSSKTNLTRRPYLIAKIHVTPGGDPISHYHFTSKTLNLMFKAQCSLKERLSIPDICKVPSGALFILCGDVQQAQRRLLNYTISNSQCVNSSQTQLLVSKASLFHPTQEPSCSSAEQPGNTLKLLLPNSIKRNFKTQ